MKALFVASVLAVTALTALPASANYACQVTYTPGASSAGSEGYVTMLEYTGPNCSGSFVANRFFCSSGASLTLCTSNPAVIYTKADLGTLFNALHDAAIFDTVVITGTSNCIGGGGGCAATVTFQ